MAVPRELQLSRGDVGSLIAIGIYIILIGVMWNAPVLKSILYPFKACSALPPPHTLTMTRAILSHPHRASPMSAQVLTVAFHESGHALAGLATCAHITSVEIDPELGGLTQMRGGIQWITLPAGIHDPPHGLVLRPPCIRARPVHASTGDPLLTLDG